MRDHALMGITTAARTAVNLGTLVLLARSFEPAVFGYLSLVITWSSIAALVTDYGFGMRALRDIGAERERAGEIMSASLAAKTLLTLAGGALALPLLAWAPSLTPEERDVALLFLLGTLANSYGDLGLTAFRSLGQFRRETDIVGACALLHFLLLGAALLAGGTLLGVGLAFLLSRLAYAVLSLHALSRRVAGTRLLGNGWGPLVARFRCSSSFAADSAATNVFAQLDVILVNQLAGREAAGLYYAGSRLLQGAVPFSVLLASVHVPRLARRVHQQSSELQRYGLRVLGEFLAVGLCFALGFYLLGPLFTEQVFGPAYAELEQLWPAFACFTAARFLAAGLGVQLIAFGCGLLRSLGTVVAGLFTFAGYVLLIPGQGIQAAPWVSALGMLLLSLIYGQAVVRRMRSGPSLERRHSAEFPPLATDPDGKRQS